MARPGADGGDVFPDRSMEHRDKIAWMIEQSGWALEPVAARTDHDPPEPPYAYTVGMESTFGFPEIVVFGLTPVAARGLVGLVVDAVADGVQVPIGPPFVGLLDHDLRCALLPVDTEVHLDRFETAAAWHRRTSFRVVQLTWPDRQGWLPWEDGFDPTRRAAQPVIGVLDDV
jgi:hypothetical protein